MCLCVFVRACVHARVLSVCVCACGWIGVCMQARKKEQQRREGIRKKIDTYHLECEPCGAAIEADFTIAMMFGSMMSATGSRMCLLF